MLVAGLEAKPAPLALPFKLVQDLRVLRLEHVARLTHHPQPVAHRDPLVAGLGVVGDVGDSVLDLVQGEEAAIDRRLHDALSDRKSTRLNSSHGYISYAV